jgi:hypothetical protein
MVSAAAAAVSGVRAGMPSGFNVAFSTFAEQLAGSAPEVARQAGLRVLASRDEAFTCTARENDRSRQRCNLVSGVDGLIEVVKIHQGGPNTFTVLVQRTVAGNRVASSELWTVLVVRTDNTYTIDRILGKWQLHTVERQYLTASL